MRRLLIIATTALLLVGAAGCSVPARLNNFVNRTERNAYRYTLRDWHYSLDRYEYLVSQYIHNYTRYTTNQKRMAMRAIGRYHALLVQAGVRESASLIYELREYAGALRDIFSRDEWAFIDFLRDVLGMREERIFDLRDRLNEEIR